MSSIARSFVKQLIPHAAIGQVRSLQTAIQRLRLPSARSIYQSAPEAPSFLSPHLLPELQRRYPNLPEYGYDPIDVERRGQVRAEEILKLPGGSTSESFLEIGCWDGMVSCALQQKGKQTIAVDNRAEGFDPRAFKAGVRLLQKDATSLHFDDESFDFVFSYDSFEHFAQPERVLSEAVRVLRKGGHLFLMFGPLYFSPFGQHVYRSITVPYCQVLFSSQTLSDFAMDRAMQPIDFSHVNGWSLEQYRNLWEKFSAVLQEVEYEEIQDLSHLELIRNFPSCFRNKSSLLENFLVSSIHALFQKRHGT
jgi:SAM-dependent methyltransferase